MANGTRWGSMEKLSKLKQGYPTAGGGWVGDGDSRQRASQRDMQSIRDRQDQERILRKDAGAVRYTK